MRANLPCPALQRQMIEKFPELARFESLPSRRATPRRERVRLSRQATPTVAQALDQVTAYCVTVSPSAGDCIRFIA
jgi:hypothetical protein